MNISYYFFSKYLLNTPITWTVVRGRIDDLPGLDEAKLVGFISEDVLRFLLTYLK